VPFSHYPKLTANVIFAWVWPAPPDRPNFLHLPRLSRLNRMGGPLMPGDSLVAYHEGINFTRFYGSIVADQRLEATFAFSNDEVAPDGHWVNDDNLKDLHYDAMALRKEYDPKKPDAAGYLVTIYGRWLRVTVKNLGDAPTEFLRVYVRGSVF
jgi:hypothetical protein